MKRYAALISYLGTNYSGWQVQAHADGHDASIQATLEETLEKIIGIRVHWQASGRTDAGVHANGQVANFTIDWEAGARGGKPEISEYHLQRGLNTLLPSAIRILDVKEAPADFHAQQHAVKKQYSYYIQTGLAPSALYAPYSKFLRGPVAIEAMNESVRFLIGEHDFKPFQAAGSKIMKTTVRTIFEAEVSDCTPTSAFPAPLDSLRLIRIRVVGTGFLRHMVRGIAGTLMQVGQNLRPTTDMFEILSSQDRDKVGPTASGHGLWLERVWYSNFSFEP